MQHIKETEAKASKRGRGVKIWLESLPSGPTVSYTHLTLPTICSV